MAGNIIVGFAPAATAGKAATGLAPAGEGAADPLGAFGALLDRMTTEGTGAIDFIPMTLQELQALATGAAQPPKPAGIEYRLAVPAEPEVDGEEALAGLVDALAQLDGALADGKPVPPALGKKISDALDALAGMLGIPLPGDPAALPAPAAGSDPAVPLEAAAAPDTATPLPPADELDALLALAGAAAPLPASDTTFTPAPADGDAGSGVIFTAPPVPAAPAAAAAHAAPAGEAPLPVTDAAPVTAALPPVPPAAGPSPSAPASATPAASQPPVDPASELGRLAGKIAEHAKTLQPQAPELAKRLDALAQKLGSGEIGPSVRAELGLDDAPSLTDNDLDRALTRLLTANSEVRGAPAPQAFAPARLELPETMALAPKSPAAASAPAPASTPAVEASADPEPRPALEPKVAEASRNDDPQPAGRSNGADARAAAAAGPDAVAEPASSAQPAVVQVATTTAVVAGAKAAHAAYQAPVHQINIPQVAFEVARQIHAGSSRFQIRLDPPELGRIDVRLDVDQSGNVNARMTVERSETLDLMQRDQRSLERALAQAGLDSSKTNLEFSLRQNPSGHDGGGDDRPKGSPFGGASGEAAGTGDDAPEQIQTLYRGSASASGVNLFV